MIICCHYYVKAFELGLCAMKIVTITSQCQCHVSYKHVISPLNHTPVVERGF